MAKKISPPSEEVIDLMKNVSPPPFITPNGITAPENLIEAARKIQTTGNKPILPSDPTILENIQKLAIQQPFPPIIKPEGESTESEKFNKPHFGPTQDKLALPPGRVVVPSKPVVEGSDEAGRPANLTPRPRAPAPPQVSLIFPSLTHFKDTTSEDLPPSRRKPRLVIDTPESAGPPCCSSPYHPYPGQRKPCPGEPRLSAREGTTLRTSSDYRGAHIMRAPPPSAKQYFCPPCNPQAPAAVIPQSNPIAVPQAPLVMPQAAMTPPQQGIPQAPPLMQGGGGIPGMPLAGRPPPNPPDFNPDYTQPIQGQPRPVYTPPVPFAQQPLNNIMAKPLPLENQGPSSQYPQGFYSPVQSSP